MKRVLLLSYYYPPYTGIEGNRVHSWAHSLANNNFEVTVVTRQWKKGGQQVWQDYFSEYNEGGISCEKEKENLSIIRVPYQWSKSFRSVNASFLPAVAYWFYKLRGNFHIETDAFAALQEAAENELRQQPFDLIIVTSPPLNIVRLGVELKKRFGVPLVVDFRDSYNNHLLNPAYRPGIKSSLENAIFRYHLEKWLKRSDLLVSVSQAVIDTLPVQAGKKQLLVMNGYGNDVPAGEQTISGIFRISYIGSLYAHQDIEFMAEGIAAFLKKVNTDKVLIQFIGLKSGTEVRTRIEAIIDRRYLSFTDRILRHEALVYMSQSEILLRVGWPGYKGMIPGKVFEYMAAKRNILVAPGDGELTDRIIQETGAGVSVHTKEEMVAYLLKKYKEWESAGWLQFGGKSEEISRYSRENQNLKLVTALQSFRQERKPQRVAVSGT